MWLACWYFHFQLLDGQCQNFVGHQCEVSTNHQCEVSTNHLRSSGKIYPCYLPSDSTICNIPIIFPHFIRTIEKQIGEFHSSTLMSCCCVTVLFMYGFNKLCLLHWYWFWWHWSQWQPDESSLPLAFVSWSGFPCCNTVVPSKDSWYNPLTQPFWGNSSCKRYPCSHTANLSRCWGKSLLILPSAKMSLPILLLSL